MFRRYVGPLAVVFGTLAVGCSESESGPAPSGLPCEVEEVFKAHCSQCHGDEPAFGAPMSLTKQTDLNAVGVDGKTKIGKLVGERIKDTRRPMPPVGNTVLSADELATLNDYLTAGGKRSDEKCTAKPDAGVDPDEVDLSECEELIELRAHNGQTEDDTEPYEVPLESDHYECFYFSVPWEDKLQALRIDPLIDDKRVLHHWLLYQEGAETALPGEHSACAGTHPNAALVSGWAPGGDPYEMPPHVGLRMPAAPAQIFTLEIHYNNSGNYTDSKDRSGARICATRKLRDNEAAAHWLGTDLLVLPRGVSSPTGTCRPTETAHILSTSPHMHQLGVHMSTIITRADGGKEALVDKPFSFDDQRMYQMKDEVVVGPGDTLVTTCKYDNTTDGIVTFGSATTQEMCYNFVVAYPVGSLGTGGSFLGGDNKCMR